MKKQIPLHLEKMQAYFSNRGFFRKKELRLFFQKEETEPTEKAFARFLRALQKQGVIEMVGYGLYTLKTPAPGKIIKTKFIPSPSPEIETINSAIQATFPYTDFLVWETRILLEFMIHLPGRNYIILETEKGAADAFFEFLCTRYPEGVFLDPDRTTFERYVSQERETTILVCPMITEFPHQTVNGIPYPKIEKILVDIFVDENKFLAYQGKEMVNIYENASQRYWINQYTLLRYAKRRKAGTKLKAFINQNTDIQLAHTQEIPQ